MIAYDYFSKGMAYILYIWRDWKGVSLSFVQFVVQGLDKNKLYFSSNH